MLLRDSDVHWDHVKIDQQPALKRTGLNIRRDQRVVLPFYYFYVFNAHFQLDDSTG